MKRLSGYEKRWLLALVLIFLGLSLLNLYLSSRSSVDLKLVAPGEHVH